MQNYAISTWNNNRMLGYEPIVAASAEEATAFAQGLLTERTRDYIQALIGHDIRYVVEYGHRSLQKVNSDDAASVVGCWRLNGSGHGSPLVWMPSAQQQGPAG